MKLWAGRFESEIDATVDAFNASLSVDKRFYKEDILGSVAHAKMLCAKSIISEKDLTDIESGLLSILEDIESGKLEIKDAEDIHSFVEFELTARVGDAGKRLHTARSRNDQVATDLRYHLMGEIKRIDKALFDLISVLVNLAERESETLMCGYTHLQRAQPISLAHHLLAYCNMFTRDRERLADCYKRTAVLPLGSAALAGTSYPIDRFAVANSLGFNSVCENSLDGVSDRDFVIELGSCLATVMMHLSRFSEEIILWCSWEFKYVELDDAFSTGSSIMPQKKNPDIAELVRGKCGRVYGNLMGILTVMKGLPLAYNKDMQEDKEGIFDSIDTVLACLEVFTPMMETVKFNRENMRKSAGGGFINATDVADYLTGKGIPFRTAYKVTGEIVAYCIKNGKVLETLSLDEYKSFDKTFEQDVFEAVNLENCLKKRTSYGGASTAKTQIDNLKAYLEKTNG
ncbi:MAG: argininosuccinate lyase [Clostridia bacterium]|nr:argininosuccinate lyase [Clostridia bacterium]